MLARRKIHNLFHPVIGEIWCLHRVVAARSPFAANRELELTPAYLEQLIAAYTARGYRFVDIGTFAHATRTRRRQKLVNISFDDGFADIYTTAYPILQRLNIPFTVYVTTGMPDGRADLWWLQLEQLANGDEAWFDTMMKEIYSTSGSFAQAMHLVTRSTPDLELCRSLALSWEQLRTMAGGGLCTVGSHGVSHAPLSLINPEQAAFELETSKQRLEEQLGTPVQHFSYPHSLFSNSTNLQAQHTGYSTAALGYGGATRHGTAFMFFRNYITQK